MVISQDFNCRSFEHGAGVLLSQKHLITVPVAHACCVLPVSFFLIDTNDIDYINCESQWACIPFLGDSGISSEIVYLDCFP
jgi:hypothetical protein